MKLSVTYAFGAFDVLVGINLLREGLDMPEVSLVTILDADKEGFLRSDRSLIQTIGRAARNINGRAILYGDRVTGSMERAIDETQRRRTKQMAYNQQHGITPKSVFKSVADILEGAVVPGRKKGSKAQQRALQPEYEQPMSAEALAATIKQLEEQMMTHSRNLEFEQAASVRDEIARLREVSFKH